MAHRTTLEADRPAKSKKSAERKPGQPQHKPERQPDQQKDRQLVFDAFRRWGYCEANLDPLGFFGPFRQPDLEGLTGPVADEARRTYCGTVGADFMHLAEPERRRWISERLESPAPE